MDKSEKDRLVQEMNDLSDIRWLSEEQKANNKSRMIEIAKILLAEHYGYTKRWDNRYNKEDLDTNQ